MKCSPPLRYDETLFRDREVFEFTHMPGDHRNGVDTQETIGKGLPENPELMRILQDRLIEEKIKRGDTCKGAPHEPARDVRAPEAQPKERAVQRPLPCGGNPKVSAARQRSLNVRFKDLCRAAETFGFRRKGGKGSHTVYVRDGIPDILNFQNVKGKNRTR